MPIATFNRHELPAGFATKTRYFKIDRRPDHMALIDMTCPHRGGPLTHGTCEGERVVCPWHTGKISRRKLEQRTQPAITNADLVMFVVDSAVARVFQSIPVDCTWSPFK
ncbi:MAG: Rieske 2Fe-2S domain-containing protein [Kofleriaceae bacterium]